MQRAIYTSVLVWKAACLRGTCRQVGSWGSPSHTIKQKKPCELAIALHAHIVRCCAQLALTAEDRHDTTVVSRLYRDAALAHMSAGHLVTDTICKLSATVGTWEGLGVGSWQAPAEIACLAGLTALE
jgi:hypothetical protein